MVGTMYCVGRYIYKGVSDSEHRHKYKIYRSLKTDAWISLKLQLLYLNFFFLRYLLWFERRRKKIRQIHRLIHIFHWINYSRHTHTHTHTDTLLTYPSKIGPLFLFFGHRRTECFILIFITCTIFFFFKVRLFCGVSGSCVFFFFFVLSVHT